MHILHSGAYPEVVIGTSKNVSLGKFWQDLEIFKAFSVSLEVSFLHGLFRHLFESRDVYQRVSGLDF